jgi:hypothetical protein
MTSTYQHAEAEEGETTSVVSESNNPNPDPVAASKTQFIWLDGGFGRIFILFRVFGFDSGRRHSFPLLKFTYGVLFNMIFSLLSRVGGPLWGTHHAKVDCACL